MSPHDDRCTSYATVRVVIEPPRGLGWLGLGEFWQYRDLLYFLTWRDIKVRYKQAALGVAWAVLQPLLMMVIFSLFFGRLAKVPSDGIPYPVFAFVGPRAVDLLRRRALPAPPRAWSTART